MSTTLVRALVLLALVSALLVRASLGLSRERTLAGILQLVGTAFLLVVVGTHIAEARHLLSWMGWGEPDSAGHFVDLASAVLGVTLLIGAFLVRMLRRRLT